MMNTEENAPKGHSDRYLLLITMTHIIGEQSRLHPRTKVWKDLLAMVEELMQIQQDWAWRRRR
jgi:hypothetical protein